MNLSIVPSPLNSTAFGSRVNRRQFLTRSAQSLAAVQLLSYAGPAWGQSPNSKLQIGVVGVANQGRYNLNNVAHENIVALCDVDERLLGAAGKDFPGATLYTDYRRMLERNDLDAVVVATPDHTHAVIGAAALRSGRHLYCEKPLARTVSETRILTELARENRRVTQMGTQIHAGGNYRRVVEAIQSGAIGTVEEVHTWVGGGYGGRKPPTDRPEIPEGLDWDLWLGPVEQLSYHPDYVPFHWRNWWHFAGGTLADLGCHHMDLAHWALDLSSPTRVEVLDGPEADPHSPPTYLVVRYEYPKRGERPPVKLTWYHGDKRPPQLAENGLPAWGGGNLFVGSKGMLLADYGRHLLFPESKFADFTPPTPTLAESIGHHKEWTEACKSGGKTTCDFSYSGPLAETVLLGNVAHRVGAALDWDAAKMQTKGSPAAEGYIQHAYRAGWTL